MLDYNLDKCYYKENEFSIYSKKEKRIFFYDFRYEDKIIEFHGDFWHANPNKFNPNDIHTILKIKNQFIIDKDVLKKELAESRDFKFLTIWESDVNADIEEQLNMCINFLKQNK
jgi:hypothetical protein